MGHPLLDEFCRISGVGNCQAHFFNRCQREFRDTINPALDERERLLVENANLKAQIAALETTVAAGQKKAQRREAGEVTA